ncbi:MAG: adenylate/guanylate cyclase domain-containing protein [Anaerolineae bacterium]
MTTILVIDPDKPEQQELRQLAHGTSDLQFVAAETGAQGLALAVERDPDLILLTAQLDDANWLDVLRNLQREVPSVPVILTTACESTGEAVRAFRAGACDYVSRPIEPPEMEETIQRALRTARLCEERDRLAEKLAETTETLSRHQQELNAVHVIGRLTTSLLDLDVVLDRLTEIALHMTDAEESMLLLRDEARGELYLHTGKNLRDELVDGFRKQLDGTAAGRAIRTGQPVLVTGDQAQLTPECPAESLLYVPVRAPDRVIGLLTLSSRRPEDVFTKQDILLLSTLVDYAAVAIQNARLFESIAESKSLMDSVFSSVASGVLSLDANGRISLINRAATRILQAPDAAPGVPLCDVCPDVEMELRPLVETTRTQGKATGPFEIDLPLHSGDVVNLRATLSPLRQGTEPTKGITVVFEDVTRQRKLESRFRLFQRYLSPAVIERLPDDPQELELGGVRREIACLFADLRGFVDFCSRHPPERLVETLNDYLGLGAEAIMAEDGTLDKFVGDAVVAFFNAPLAQENYVLRAARAAIKIRESTKELHARLDPAHRLTFGMGLSVGEALVGNIGTPQRLDYTAIGPSVNLANRLQAAAEPGQILLTPQVYERLKNQIVARPLDLEGKAGPEAPFRAYELLDLS